MAFLSFAYWSHRSPYYRFQAHTIDTLTVTIPFADLIHLISHGNCCSVIFSIILNSILPTLSTRSKRVSPEKSFSFEHLTWTNCILWGASIEHSLEWNCVRQLSCQWNIHTIQIVHSVYLAYSPCFRAHTHTHRHPHVRVRADRARTLAQVADCRKSAIDHQFSVNKRWLGLRVNGLTKNHEGKMFVNCLKKISQHSLAAVSISWNYRRLLIRRFSVSFFFCVAKCKMFSFRPMSTKALANQPSMTNTRFQPNWQPSASQQLAYSR